MTTNHRRPSTLVFLCWSVVVLASVGSAIGIAILAPRMAPIQPGSSNIFWKLACDVSLSPEINDDILWLGDAYFVDDTWAAYDFCHAHGCDTYFLSASEASSDFDAVVATLQQAYERGEDSWILQGYVIWRDDTKQPRDARALLENIRRVRQQKVAAGAQSEFGASFTQSFWVRWERRENYWANIVFEWTFLSGLALFTLWPGIRKRSGLRWAIHVGLFPILFLLPAYLGYATFSFASQGPSGGILYALMLWWVRGGSVNSLDEWVLAHLPPLLEPLCSTPAGSPLELVQSGIGMPGPCSAVVAGVLIGALIFGTHYLSITRRTEKTTPR